MEISWFLFANFMLILYSSCFIQALPVFFRGHFMGHNFGRNKNCCQNKHISALWFTQMLDHFDPSNTRTWRQRYFVNTEYAVSSGPVFIMIGGEGPLNPAWMTNGQWCQNYGKLYGALCVSLEHRFYGDSHPTSDLSDANLVYLTSEQALADLANFQTFLTRKLSLSGRKWISFGGSYPGSLSAWYRLKYPHLVSGAISTSAPLQALLNFKQYLEVVQNSLRLMFGEECPKAFLLVTVVVDGFTKTDVGRRLLKRKLRLCDDIVVSDTLSMANLYSTMAENIAGIVQYNRDNRAFEGALGVNLTIKKTCGYMVDVNTPDVLDRYSNFIDAFMKEFRLKCIDFKYDNLVNELRNTAWSSAEGGRQWTYQTCAEFGFFQSSDSLRQPFGHYFPANFFERQCSDIFGSKYNMTFTTAAIKWTNENYGGINIKTSNTVFVNGNVDPWHALGLTQYHGPSSTALLINGTAHCANMYPDTPADPVQLREARRTISKMIGLWLGQ